MWWRRSGLWRRTAAEGGLLDCCDAAAVVLERVMNRCCETCGGRRRGTKGVLETARWEWRQRVMCKNDMCY